MKSVNQIKKKQNHIYVTGMGKVCTGKCANECDWILQTNDIRNTESQRIRNLSWDWNWNYYRIQSSKPDRIIVNKKGICHIVDVVVETGFLEIERK